MRRHDYLVIAVIFAIAAYLLVCLWMQGCRRCDSRQYVDPVELFEETSTRQIDDTGIIAVYNDIETQC